MNINNEKGRKRLYRIEIRLNEIENSKLTYDSLTTGISRSELIRNLIINNEVKQKPDRKFYEMLDNLYKIYARLTQIVEFAEKNNYTNYDELKEQENNIKNFVNAIEKRYL